MNDQAHSRDRRHRTEPAGVPSAIGLAPAGPPVARLALGFLFWTALCFGVAGAGGAITATSVQTWYQTLEKPSWTPPDWVFGPVWTVLYLLMALAAFLVWRPGGWKPAKAALGCFVIQLALNLGWSVLFFGLRSPGLAFLDVVILWLFIMATLLLFQRHPRSRPSCSRPISCGPRSRPCSTWRSGG